MIYLIIIGAFVAIFCFDLIVTATRETVGPVLQKKNYEKEMQFQQMEVVMYGEWGKKHWGPIASRKQREKFGSDEPYLPCGKRMWDEGDWKCPFDDDKDFGPNHVCDADHYTKVDPYYIESNENKTKEFVQGQPWVGK